MKKILFLLILILFTACVPKPTKQLASISYGQYHESSFDKIGSWEDENFAEAFTLFKKTCDHVKTNELFKVVCSNTKTQQSARAFFENNFTPFSTLAKLPKLGGYYEALLYGSLKRTSTYTYPVYGLPKDMFTIDILASYKEEFSKSLRGHIVAKKIKPYFSRTEINDGAIKTRPLCYVNDRIDLYFLQEEGTGRIVFPNKKSIYLGYSDFNGHPYTSINDEMLRRKLLKKGQLSPQNIREYLRKHPELQDKIFNANDSYTFFDKYKQRATGALGIVLTKHRSVAVDKRNIPLGTPMFVSMKDSKSDTKVQSIMFAHDTREELKGSTRVEVFFGSGNEARAEAEAVQEDVKLWILIPNDYLHHDYLLRSKYL
ncbi:murein transglycosylase A [Sulfurimonas sp. MAG313]|nr:murein transglycosylase A [Sulfurimonas sp. MAG313]MDF1880100.1 murein transglycosylase A [Sulfurimonas sp. MAG313]